jgi:hypothetical protein
LGHINGTKLQKDSTFKNLFTFEETGNTSGKIMFEYKIVPARDGKIKIPLIRE